MRKGSRWQLISILMLLAPAGCLNRPIGRSQPRTTNVLVDVLRRDAVTKIDLLFMIDNSRSMSDKQVLFAEALPDLVAGLVTPPCLTPEGDNVAVLPADQRCPMGSAREFEPVQDIHIGLVTSSLGGYTTEDCTQTDEHHSEENVDDGHLLASLPRGAAAAPSAAKDGFLAWRPKADNDGLIEEFGGLVRASGEHGCGLEASLESWYRFLVDPAPYAELVQKPCSASDKNELCIAPRTDEAGAIVADQTILQQRAQFLRPDSLVAIVMLTDENDCSFKVNGLTRMLVDSKGFAYRGTAACDDPAQGPNSPCCHSCLQVPPAECATAVDDRGRTVGAGCEESKLYDDAHDDATNLRCFEQKRRFGVDLLYPVARYSNALTLDRLCPFADDLNPNSPKCPDGRGVIDNPLFVTATNPLTPRPHQLVYLAGIVGVPWQDVAMTPDGAEPLVYRSADPMAPEARRIDWSWLLGDAAQNPATMPGDPLMIESIEARQGVNPATQKAIAPVDAAYDANPINGHEWSVEGADPEGARTDLQYACIFPLREPVTCKTDDELTALGDAALDVPDCDCTNYGEPGFDNPLCQQSNGQYGLEQTRAKAYPAVRELQVLKNFGANSVVASICPKSIDTADADYGYRPAMAAIVERLKEGLQEKCFDRELAVRPDNTVECIMVEARSLQAGEASGCALAARSAVAPEVAASARKKLLSSGQCADEASCAALELCEIKQITAQEDADGLTSCQNDKIASGNGWCYVDEELGIGNPELVAQCPNTSRRKVRFVGDGTPKPNTKTVVACAGAAFQD
ncbi:MAG TPA: hypothetical protein VHM70_22410 [Polyangiaceae bacterium]|nr:hypothetical protein [Polyangiaceae bacterium]